MYAMKAFMEMKNYITLRHKFHLMNKIRFLAFIFSLATLASMAKEKSAGVPPKVAVQKGNVVLTAGYGAPSIIRAFLKYKTTRDEIQVYGAGPFILKGEYLITKNVSIGLNGSYSQSKVTWFDVGYDTIQQKYRDFEFGIKAYEVSGTLRANYHFWRRRHIDSYAGLAFGYGFIRMQSYTLAHTTKFSIVYDVPRPLNMECTWGFRYFPTKSLGFYTEAGIGKSWLLYHKYFLPEALIQGGIVVRL